MTEQKIPKKIHYCWFGGAPFPQKVRKCMESWKKFCPDYELIEWNETNFDFNCNDYVKEAHAAKKWAFVTDVARLHALVEQGGIYLDTDVELLKSPDGLLGYDGVLGFETEARLSTGFMAAKPRHPAFKAFLESYENARFCKEDGSYDLTTNVTRVTEICVQNGLSANNTVQTVNGVTFFPKDVFSPLDYETGELKVTENTVAIHHYESSWLTEEDKLAQSLKRKYVKRMPKKLAGYAAKFAAIKRTRGFKAAVKETCKWIKKK